MTPELIVMATFALAFLGGLTACVLYIRELRGILRDREIFIRQLLDRLATHEYAKGDPAIPRIFANRPPSVQEESVSGPHGRALNRVAGQTDPTLEAELARRKAGRKTEKLKLDTADEFDRKPEK